MEQQPILRQRHMGITQIGARLPPPGSLALGAQKGKLYADLRISAQLAWHAFGLVGPRLLSLRYGGRGPVDWRL
jgi:hypothetical protein